MLVCANVAAGNLVIHCVIMGRQNPQTPRLLKYLIDAVPESLETRSSQGKRLVIFTTATSILTLIKVTPRCFLLLS